VVQTDKDKMAESANSSSVSVTPSFTANKFQQPAWYVQVNGTPVQDAVLEKVELGFGSDLSTCSFLLPKNPLTSTGNPVENDIVEAIVNDKVIFKGKIRVIIDHIGSDGLKISYTAFSNIIDLNKGTIWYGSFNSDNADYRLYRYNVPPILSIIGVSASGVPNMYPGEVNVTDQTQLTATESILNKVGNYKLYYDMVNQALSVYQLQTGGVNTRSFLPGKNIIRYDINKSTENVVDQVIVMGQYEQITSYRSVNAEPRISPSGRYELSFTLSGRNIRGIQVEGRTREKPNIEYDMSKKINKAMIAKYRGLDPANDSWLSALNNKTYRTENFPLSDKDSTQAHESAELYPHVISCKQNAIEWATVPTTVVQRGPDLIDVYISEVPKLWYPLFIKQDIPDSVFGISGGGSSEIQIVDGMDFTTGSMRVIITVDGIKPYVTVGSGSISRSITDSQYQIIANTITGYVNTATVIQAMQIRAQAEYNRLHYPVISGTISVLGDETIDLKQTILIEGLRLDILHVTHNFTNGFTTDVTITNERFIPSIILRPPQWYPQRNAENEKDRRKGLLIYTLESEAFKKDRLAKSEKKKNEELPNGGGHAVVK
jgi:hypothetical protein